MNHALSVPAPRTGYTARLRSLIDIVSVVLISLSAGHTALTNLHTSYDDAYITYRYAYNFAQGYGFVYNHNEHFMGTTAPFYGLLLGVLGWPNPDMIPLISNYLSGLSLLLIGLGLYLYARLHGAPFCGLLAALFFVINPLLPPTFGGEMLFQAALIIWAFVLYRLDRTLPAALLLGIAILTRPDSAVALGVIGLHYLYTRRRFPWRELIVVAIVLVPLIGISRLFYGSPLPGTLDAKTAQRDSGLWPLFTAGTIEWLRGFTIQDSSRMFRGLPAGPAMERYIWFVMLGVPMLLWVFRFWLLPLSWIVLYTLGYHILNVPFYHWYVVPIIVGLMILAACGAAGVIEGALRLMRRIRRGQNFGPLVATFKVASLIALAPGMYAQMAYNQRLGAKEPSGGKQLYIQTGRWLRENTPSDASVGFFEIGYLGYYAQRTIIDPVGLVNPGVASHVAKADLTWAYRHYQPDYIVHNPLIFQPHIGKMLQEPWFTDNYRKIAEIEFQGSVLPIYQRTTPR